MVLPLAGIPTTELQLELIRRGEVLSVVTTFTTIEDLISRLRSRSLIGEVPLGVYHSLTPGQELYEYFPVPSGIIRLPRMGVWRSWGDPSVEVTVWVDIEDEGHLMIPTHRMSLVPSLCPVKFIPKRSKTILRWRNHDTVNSAEGHMTGLVYNLRSEYWLYFEDMLRQNLEATGIKEIE